MSVPLLENLRAGTRFIRENPQVVSTIVIAVIIIASFLFISDRFLNVASSTQERLIEDRIASAVDVFAIFAGEKFDNPSDLSLKAALVLAENDTFTSLKVVKFLGQKYEVIASTNSNEIGMTDLENAQWYGFALADPSGHFRIPIIEGEGRGYKTVRTISDGNGIPLGAVLLEASLASVDVETRSRIRMSYMILVLIIILVTVLFLRHARIIDYTKLYTELKGVDQMKDDFLSMASHELRTPLTIIRGYADLIGGAQGLSEQDKINVHNITIAADQLNTLVADMLDVSRVEQGRLEFKLEPINTTTHVKELALSFGEPAKQKGLNLVVEVPELPKISADKDRLRQALINLIGNAVKYTPQGEVKVTGGTQNGMVWIRVSDTGLGISAEEQKNLFQKFYRVKTEETAKITGTGLGLWITKEMITKMAGTITVESIKGTGSQFTVSFPAIGNIPTV